MANNPPPPNQNIMLPETTYIGVYISNYKKTQVCSLACLWCVRISLIIVSSYIIVI